MALNLPMVLNREAGYAKKIAISLGVLALGFAFGISATIIYAHIIPGVDRPFDPANYYSLDTISAADSAPSAFALRDLAAQGGQVYDYSRHIKSIEAAKQFLSQLSILLEQNTINEKFALLIQLKQLKNMQRADDTAVDTAKKIGTSLHVLDPYSEVEKNMINSYYDYFGKEKYEAKSMPNFR